MLAALLFASASFDYGSRLPQGSNSTVAESAAAARMPKDSAARTRPWRNRPARKGYGLHLPQGSNP